MSDLSPSTIRYSHLAVVIVHLLFGVLTLWFLDQKKVAYVKVVQYIFLAVTSLSLVPILKHDYRCTRQST